MDPNFTPGSDEYEQQLFEEQQDFLYSVLKSSLKTEFSDALVKDHEGDAQLILDLLHCRILGLTTLNSLLQYVNWVFWEVCSVN